MPCEAIRTRLATPADSAGVAAVYNPYVLGSTVTFEEEEVGPEEMASRLAVVAAADLPWLVAEGPEGIVGYAYASRWKGRSGYRHSVETSVYLAPHATGRGLGRRLYEDLYDRLRARRLHAVMAGIALPNAASVALHERMGLRQVALFREVGLKFGRWIDVGYWQALWPTEAP
jgi:phosphinothricin acetyltransferase